MTKRIKTLKQRSVLEFIEIFNENLQYNYVMKYKTIAQLKISLDHYYIINNTCISMKKKTNKHTNMKHVSSTDQIFMMKEIVADFFYDFSLPRGDF
jgi:CRISPR/Cas system endoribonuclease Cas6 (RAMP superfamily)